MGEIIMIIELTKDLPIDKKHKCFKGKRFTVYAKRGRRDAVYYFKDENDTECGAFPHEFEIIEGHPSDIPNRDDTSDLKVPVIV
jgi:hypothetical protein